MQFSSLIQERQSIRKYQARSVQESQLQAVVEAANRAPSAGNFQSFEIFVVRGPERLRALAEATFDQKFVAEANVALIVCSAPKRCQYQPAEYFALQDATIATTFAMLAVTDQGLATCWVGAFSPEKIASAMNLPGDLKPIAILPIGYAAETPERTSRRLLGEMVHEL